MRVRETFYRGNELARERRAMPARTYNLTRILLTRTGDAFVFVPIRSMQYLAIVESAEFNFLHSEERPDIELSWQNFAPAERSGLDDPVAYDAVYYRAHAAVTMRRLQGEFLRALEQMAARSAPAQSGAVWELKRR
jgi:hypothetical protein